ncbi:MAG: FAD-dependent oxidoreductase, partial [Ruminococcus sp.]|nr:FAD-dependent oxidoreductase [Ruminococcus sp.]
MKYDVGIIGSGPAGLSAAIYAKRANLSAVVIEKEYEGTGQIAESGQVDNYPGFPGISGYDLGENFREHAVKLGVSFMEQEVTEIKKEASSDFELVFADGSQVEAKTVIYAAGATPRRANIPGEQEYAGKGVSYCAICDGSFYRGKSVAVLGGGDTALDDAVYLADVAEKVYVIHRRKEFRGAAVTVAKLREKENVIFVLEHQVKEIIGEQKVTGVVLEDAAVIDVNGVFVAYGAVPQTDLLKKFAVLDDSGYVRAGETGETALEGLYVAG